ncbi:MAG: C4-dicarboxylate transporter DctA, partial [Sphingomonadaceae bacterium]
MHIALTSPAAPPRRPLWRQLYVQVIAAILVGGLIGHLAPETGVALKPLGDAFIQLVKLVIA